MSSILDHVINIYDKSVEIRFRPQHDFLWSSDTDKYIKKEKEREI